MSKEVIDYKAVLVDLEARRAAMNARFDAAIAALRDITALNNMELQPSFPGMAMPALPAPLSANLPYRDMGIVEASMKHLASVKRNVPNLRLADALEKGGFVHKSRNFPNTLNSVLTRRAKNKGDVFKNKNGWGLTEWKRGVSLKPSDAVKEESSEPDDV